MIIQKVQSTGAGERSFQIEKSGPTGAFPARIVDIIDSIDVEVPKFGEVGIMERKNTTRFLIAYSANGETHLVQSWEMTQSASERSALFKFLRDMKGEAPVFDGTYDYCHEIGQTCQVTVSSKTSKKGTQYNYIASIAPLMEELAEKAPKLESVEIPGGRRTPLDEDGDSPFSVEAS
jgi:hypothetical protein